MTELPRMLHHPDGGRLIVTTVEELTAKLDEGWGLHRVGIAVEDTQEERAPGAERSAPGGQCEQCHGPCLGRPDKRFCRDACRTRFGREQKARDLAEGLRDLSARALALVELAQRSA
jgi:hypothetical protein